MRALDYVKSLPEWDGKTLIVHGGSQGALQALAAAALDRDVSFVVANAPAMCDQAGELAGRMSPWPHAISQAGMERVAPFFDGAAFARRITAPVRFTVGFSDTTRFVLMMASLCRKMPHVLLLTANHCWRYFQQVEANRLHSNCLL